MKIYISSDHAGFDLKLELISRLKTENYEIEDCGPKVFDPNDDYPDFIKLTAEKISNTPDSFGIVIGKSGTGEAIVANKFKNVRCALFYGGNFDIIKLAREHNNANILSLGAGFLNIEEAHEATKLFLQTPFSNEERHQRRIEKITILEK